MSTMHHFLSEPLSKDVATALERLAQAPGVRRIAVMPDVHLAEHVCVGTVVATDHLLYPQAVGGDIGCGIATVRLAGTSDLLRDPERAQRLLGELRRCVPVVRQPKAREAPLPELRDHALLRRIQRDLRVEFGTVGRGNHFVEVQADEDERLWLVAHSGSRALGPAIRAHYLQRVAAGRFGLCALRDDEVGADYFADHVAAVGFAAANRRAIAEAAVAAIREVLSVSAEWHTWVDVVHNFVRREEHDGERLWVHRKGACSASLGEPGIIPGSMGTATFHVEGRGHADSLRSSSHGAGRRLARGEAMRRISERQLERDLDGVFFEQRLLARLRDEAPSAYKDIAAVMRAQRELVRIVRRLRPVLVHKGA